MRCEAKGFALSPTIASLRRAGGSIPGTEIRLLRHSEASGRKTRQRSSIPGGAPVFLPSPSRHRRELTLASLLTRPRDIAGREMALGHGCESPG